MPHSRHASLASVVPRVVGGRHRRLQFRRRRRRRRRRPTYRRTRRRPIRRANRARRRATSRRRRPRRPARRHRRSRCPPTRSRWGWPPGDPDGSSVVLWTRLTGELPPDGIDVEWEITSAAGDQLAVRNGARRNVDGRCGARRRSAVGTGDLSLPRRRLRISWGSRHPARRDRVRGRRVRTPRLRLVPALRNRLLRRAPRHRRVATRSGRVPRRFHLRGCGEPGRGRSGPVTRGAGAVDWRGTATRYATYLSDHHLQASRAACPWLVIWDDHEVENNYAGLVPTGSGGGSGIRVTPGDGVPGLVGTHADPAAASRSRSAPTIRSTGASTSATWWRSRPLDGRQYRSDQVCDSTLDVGPPCAGWDDPTRTMLGTEQEAWLAGRFSSTTSRWNCVAQQTVMTDLRFAGTGGILNYDQWDGYAPHATARWPRHRPTSSCSPATSTSPASGCSATPPGRRRPVWSS